MEDTRNSAGVGGERKDERSKERREGKKTVKRKTGLQRSSKSGDKGS